MYISLTFSIDLIEPPTPQEIPIPSVGGSTDISLNCTITHKKMYKDVLQIIVYLQVISSRSSNLSKTDTVQKKLLLNINIKNQLKILQQFSLFSTPHRRKSDTVYHLNYLSKFDLLKNIWMIFPNFQNYMICVTKNIWRITKTNKWLDPFGAIRYCVKVIQLIFDKIPCFLWLNWNHNLIFHWQQY